MNAEFFALAFLAALNPKLLALDLLLIENRRPRAMFLWLLAGGLTVGLTIGLLDVLVFHVNAINHERSTGAGVDLALGLFLLGVGALFATGRVPGRRRARVPAGGRPPPEQPEAGEEGGKEEAGEEGGKKEAGEEGGKKKKKDGWAQRLLAEPRLTLALLVGAVIGIPGASYLTALHHLVAGKYPTVIQVIAVVVFVVIGLLLIIIPFAFLELRPEATKVRLKSTQAWLLGHAQQLVALVALLLGAYLTISAAVRLS
jgi:Sap, sulfolipid-1-addressing protein